MATQPQSLPADAALLLHDLAKRQAHFSYGVLFVLLLFVGFGGFFGYRAIQSFDKQVETMQKQMKQDKAQLATDKKADDAATKQQQVIVKVVHERDVETDKKIDQVNVDNSLQAASDFVAAYHLNPVERHAVAGEGWEGLQLDLPTAKLAITTKFDRDRLFADNQDVLGQYHLEQGKTANLTRDLNLFKTDAQKWENLANKSKKRKFFEGALKGLEIGGAGFLGFELGHHTSNVGVVVRP